jgi:hypothetical protein
MKYFTISLYSAQQLLSEFVLPKSFDLNPNWNPTQYNLYEIIGLLASCIGGSLTYTSRSAECLTMYPRVTISPQETIVDILKKFIYLTSDVVVFRGVDAIVIDAQDDDPAVYDYGTSDHPIARLSIDSEIKTLSRSHVAGVTNDGRPAYGLSGSSGETFVMLVNPMCVNEAMATAVATNVITKSRLLRDLGDLLTIPNLGTENHDVISVNGIGYRVSGFSRILDKVNHKFQQVLNLTNV